MTERDLFTGKDAKPFVPAEWHLDWGGHPFDPTCACACHTEAGRNMGMMHFRACCEPKRKVTAGAGEGGK